MFGQSKNWWDYWSRAYGERRHEESIEDCSLSSSCNSCRTVGISSSNCRCSPSGHYRVHSFLLDGSRVCPRSNSWVCWLLVHDAAPLELTQNSPLPSRGSPAAAAPPQANLGA